MNCYGLRKALAVVAVVVSPFMLAGCGGDDDSAAAAVTNPTPTIPPPATVNGPPTISGTPGASVTEGQRYTFVPVAVDPDGDMLGFSIENKPVWATFDTATGRLSGTPSTSHVGTHANIRIVASDAAHSTALSPFTIEVGAIASAATGAATLSWTPPTQNTDGSATNLAGYEVRYGRSSNALDQTVKLNNPSLNTYVVENLEAGKWFFTVVAVSKQGAMSEQSNVASKTIG
jgi:Putative Ig domain